MDLTAALTFLSKQAEQAAVPVAFHPPAEPDHVYLMFRPGMAAPQRVEAAPAPRDHAVSDIASLVAALRLDAGKRHTVWYSRAAVVGVYDDATRRDRVTLPVGLSPQILALQALQSRTTKDQRALILFLRTTLFGCVPPTLLDLFKQVNFQTLTEQQQSNKASLGKKIESKLTGVAEIPDEIDVTVPVFANPLVQVRRPVKLSVDVEPAQGLFVLQPLPLQIEEAVTAAELELGGRIAAAFEADDGAAAASVLYGSPEVK